MQSNVHWRSAYHYACWPLAKGARLFFLASIGKNRIHSAWSLLLFTLLLAAQPQRATGQIGQLSINPINNTNVTVGNTLTIPITLTNTAPANLVWSLSSPPTGATVTTNTVNPDPAIFSWTPSASQTGSVSITVNVIQFDDTSNHTNASFIVTVNPTNSVPTPPSLGTVSDQTIAVGQLLTLTNSAHTTDGTSNALTFSLAAGAPAGATFTNNSPTTGVFKWAPTTAQGPVAIGMVVTEQSSPPLSTTQTFNVTVILTNQCPGYQDFLDSIAQGGTVFLPDCETIVLSNTIDIATDVVLDTLGQDVTIAGNHLVRLFTVEPNASLTLVGLTLSAGRDTNGGALYVKSGGTAFISDCVFAGNGAVGSNGVSGVAGGNSSGTAGNGKSGSSGVSGYGGAIYNAGTLVISNSQFLTNLTVGGTGGNGGNGGNGGYQGGNGGNGGNGGRALGGAIYNGGSLSLESCTFDGNAVGGGSGGTGGANGDGPFTGLPGIGGTAGAGSGAGIYSTGSLTVASCTFSENSATGGTSAAGGTQSNGNGSNGPRGGEGSGGGIFSSGINAITNSTFFGNSVTGGNGGNGGNGNYNAGNGGSGGNGLGGAIDSAGGSTFVVNCTIAQNQAQGGTNGVAGSGGFPGTDGSPGVARGAGVYRGAGTFYLQNSILVTNSPGTNAFGTITDGGSNLSSDTSLKGTSRKNVDPKLEGLSSDPPQVMALKAESPAIDAADDAAAPDVDEVGTMRPVGPHSDIGAFEYATPLAPEITTPPGSASSQIGGSVTFSAIATGQTPLSYQWQFNGANISGATKSSYTLTNIQPANAGDYTVSVSNRLGVTTSSAGTLTVIQFYSISGHVRDGSSGISGVTVTAETNSAVTDTTGAYVITNVASGEYTVFASATGYRFSESQQVTVGPNQPNIDFTVTEHTYTISGRVTAGGVGLSGVRILGGISTDQNGSFNFQLPASTNVLMWDPLESTCRHASLSIL